MWKALLILLSLIGSIGLFLYGMKLMSDSLQKVAGFRMRAIIASVASNRFKAIMSGLAITGIIQSSSAVTVMIVSFVNAGLLSLTEAVGMIMGANIGTTLKAWIFVTIGLNIKISSFALPLFGIGFFLLFIIRNSQKYWGEFVVGLSLIFLGLEYLLLVIPDLTAEGWFVDMVSTLNNQGFFSIALFFLIGTILASIFQSSSAAMALSLVLASKGIVNLPLAIAMVLGENVGTTITANLAALVTNVSAKKAARFHFLFNFIGVIWAFILFNPFLKGIDSILVSASGKSAFTDPAMIPYAIAVAHTTFNTINTLVMIWFVPQVLVLADKLVKHKYNEEEKFRLKYISKTIFSTSEISLLQVRSEIRVYAKRIRTMYGYVKTQFNEVNDESFQSLYKKISNYEGICDRMENEIVSYLNQISENGLSRKSADRVKLMLRITSNLESIGDSIYNIGKVLQQKRKNKIWFTQEIRNNINQMFTLLDEAFDEMYSNLSIEYSDVNPHKAKELEKKINELRNQLKAEYLTSTEERPYKYEAGVVYSDIFSKCERLGDHIYEITQVIVAAGSEEV
ncbi:MAG TPA: Na/Pi cotransporter family protein [Bacteroidales bacterium]|nr:Na/Pi cotransporter family protein [Bacteroidales bacterium]